MAQFQSLGYWPTQKQLTDLIRAVNTIGPFNIIYLKSMYVFIHMHASTYLSITSVRFLNLEIKFLVQTKKCKLDQVCLASSFFLFQYYNC